jgi:acyl-coenzyme A thioesterase PaaI-like protein
MTEPNVLARQCADAMWDDDAASRGLGMTPDHVTAGRARMSMLVRAEMVNGHGLCHGGFIFALADSAMAFAANSYQTALRLTLRHMPMALMTLDIVGARRVGVNAGWYHTVNAPSRGTTASATSAQADWERCWPRRRKNGHGRDAPAFTTFASRDRPMARWWRSFAATRG